MIQAGDCKQQHKLSPVDDKTLVGLKVTSFANLLRKTICQTKMLPKVLFVIYDIISMVPSSKTKFEQREEKFFLLLVINFFCMEHQHKTRML